MIELIGVKPGTKLSLIGDITAEVLESINEEWVKIRLLTVPEGKGNVGDEELCHATDVKEIL
jgi:hypothetical protein